jgi:hypothetical protein
MPDVTNVGALTGNNALIFKAQVYLALDQALNNLGTAACWRGTVAPICLYQPVQFQQTGVPGLMGRTVVDTAVFAWSPPTAQMELMTPGPSGQPLQPLVRENLTVKINKYGVGYFVPRDVFFADVWGTLRSWVTKLSRPIAKLGDALLAAVLRTGKVTPDPVVSSVNFFATNKPQAPSGSLSSATVYSNLFTGCPLTPAGIIRVYNSMRAIKGEDNYSLNVKPDTLIVPAEQEAAAMQACGTEYPVYSQSANPWNIGAAGNPGQAAATAAMGQNIVYLQRWVRQIQVLPELTIGGASIDQTSWYFAECANSERGGAPGLLLCDDAAVDMFFQLSNDSVATWNSDTLAVAARKFSGAGPGLGAFISRADV